MAAETKEKRMYFHSVLNPSESSHGYLNRGRWVHIRETKREKLVPFRGREVLTVQVTEVKDEIVEEFAIIPGYVVSKEGYYTSEVEPLVDSEERKELSDLLRNDLKGILNFW